ncbi:hypothetical protein LCGC14_0358220 [marine sediment metagenome]|uniref:Uncharacterized protein n=1 Tax=marine sediment metagenome TaxID=412755 RepID=A0A0F9VW53_9ZZZZ
MNRKTIVVAIVIVSLIAVLGYVVNEYVLTDSNLRATKQKIKTYRIIAEEQRLVREILQDKIVIAKIQAAFAPVDPNSP